MSLTERIEKDSLEAQRLTRKFFVVGLSFSQDSLKELDELADNVDVYMHGGLSDENVELLTRTWGAYFGEVLKRMDAGDWVESENEFGAKMKLKSGLFSPHERVRDRLKEGSDHSLAAFAAKLSG